MNGAINNAVLKSLYFISVKVGVFQQCPIATQVFFAIF